jgi:hypothetical protein
MKWLVVLCAGALCGIACASGSDDPLDSDSGTGPASSAGTGGEGATGAGGDGVGGSSAGGSGPCGTELDQQGCTCTPGEPARECYPGPAGQAGKGACAMGTQTCTAVQSGEFDLGTWGECTGAGEPGAPGCDGSDQDCDGAPDPACGCAEGTTQACSTVCGAGTEICMGGIWVGCTAPPPNADQSCPEPGGCIDNAPAPSPWEAFDFVMFAAPTSCNGAKYVREFPAYQLWVGAILCSPTRYKLFLSSAKNGTFHQIGDFAGHGQDHCELVNLGFSIPNEDDITSGGCAACATGPMIWSDAALGPGWSRATYGECFTYEPSWPQFNLHSVEWYECGVTIP